MSGLRKRSVVVSGHATSVSLEEEFWRELTTAAKRRNLSLNALISEIDMARDGNLSSALRLFVLREVRAGDSNSL
jgi:predicted DNA-binding ribbon-helix-helix protein